MRFAWRVVLFTLLAACRGPGIVTPSGDLSYRTSGGSSLLYQAYDSIETEIAAEEWGSLTIREAVGARVSMVLQEPEDGMHVTATFPELSIETVNPVEGTQSISEDDLEGSLSFDLGARGDVKMGSLPAMTPAAEAASFPIRFLFEMFPVLPEETLYAGASWTDSTSYHIETPNGDSETRSALTYTVAGDTVWKGIHALTGSYTGTMGITSSASMQGLEIFQSVSGEVTGAFLLDPIGGRLLLNEMSSTLQGTAEIPAAGVPPRLLEVRRQVRFQLLEEN